MRHRPKPCQSGAGFEIIKLDHDDDVELFARIVQGLNGA